MNDYYIPGDIFDEPFVIGLVALATSSSRLGQWVLVCGPNESL